MVQKINRNLIEIKQKIDCEIFAIGKRNSFFKNKNSLFSKIHLEHRYSADSFIDE
jgi:hypothetical protein